MTLRPIFSPPTIYHDGASLFLELPGSPGQTLLFPFTEGGLSKALRFVPNIAKQPGYLTGGANITPKSAGPLEAYSASSRLTRSKVKVSKATARAREKASFSPAAREAAGAVIRKLKIGD